MVCNCANVKESHKTELETPLTADKMDLKPCSLVSILFAFPLAFGLGLIGLSFHVRSGYSSYFSTVLNNEEWDHAMNLTIVFIVVGILVILLTCLTLFGIIMGNSRVLMVITIAMGTLLLVVEIMAFILLYTKEYDNMRIAIRKSMNISMGSYYNISGQTRNSSVEFWDNLQINMKCCGVDSYAEWANSNDSPIFGFIPNSCCIKGTQVIEGSCTEPITRNLTKSVNFASNFIHTEGCYHRFVSYYSVDLLLLTIFLLGCTQLLSISILGSVLIRMRNNSYEGLGDDDDSGNDEEDNTTRGQTGAPPANPPLPNQ